MTLDLQRLQADLVRDEDIQLRPYRCTAGKLTLGVGHNIDDKPITRRAAMVILEDDIADALADLDRNAPWWRGMSEGRQRALANMCFQMGWPKLAGFKNMLAAMRAGDWARAAEEARNSAWYRQTTNRAERVIALIKEG